MLAVIWLMFSDILNNNMLQHTHRKKVSERAVS